MTPEQAVEYLNGKFRSYDERAVRYRLSAYAMILMGLEESDSIIDFGGGEAELEKCLREEFGWTGTYTNVDYSTGMDIKKVLNDFDARKSYVHDFVASLEVVEHFDTMWAKFMLDRLPKYARKGVVLTTPNPLVQNVYEMDATHVTPIGPNRLAVYGYTVEEHMLYDGYYSQGQVDGLVAYQKGRA